MSEMTMTSSPTSLPTSFNAFLYATVCEGRDEHPVSVISALARLDLDPWTEAAELASMTAVGAAERLSSLLAGVPGGPDTLADRKTVADRLVGLLPTPARTNIEPGAGRAHLLPYARSLGIMWLIILASMAASAWVEPAPAGAAHAAGAKSTPAVVTDR